MSPFALLALLLCSPQAPPEGFAALSGRAAAARDAGRTEEAAFAYRGALALRADWDEGWWYLGALLYESKRCAEANAAFERFLALKPDAGPGWVMRGVCAFELRDFASAIDWLGKGTGLGLGGNAELQRVARSRLAFALVTTGQFELAIPSLTVLARLAPDTPGLVEATGLALLRLPLLPSEVPADRRDLVERLGRAGRDHLARRGEEAARGYADVVAAYPDEPWVRYAHGVFLLRSGDELGLDELRRAVALKPDNVTAHLEIAFELLTRRDYAGARESATKAVELAPTLFAGRNALGRALVELGELEAGIRELEEAKRLAPESYETHFALARAYARAGRDADAARERALFTELEERQRASPDRAPRARSPRARDGSPHAAPRGGAFSAR